MIYCRDCEIWWDEADVVEEWVDKYGDAWCPCGCDLQSIDPDHHPVYDTLEEKYL